MRIELYLGSCLGKYVIRRGDAYFCFFVDHDKSCWTNCKFRGIAVFNTRAEAEECLLELLSMARLRRKERKKPRKEIN